MDWSHPVLAFGALIVGALVGWVRGRRPMKLDVTIRHEAGTDTASPPTDNRENHGNE